MAELSTVDWSRAQFALTALYHFLFVPLTLGLSFLVAFMESIYVKTGDEKWLKITKFWMKLFAINFAVGVATGLIMEFEFGTNWANYSWFVGDIFGAPLAAEGIFAFFLEATFFAVMFFGWNKVSKGFHLLSTWLVAIGSNLSAFWILVANGWMQFPTGTTFNAITARNEMTSFFDVISSPVALSKFVHTTSGGFITASLFVAGVSALFMLKNKHLELAKKSFMLAVTFGLLSSLYAAFSGDESAYQVAKHQPMKLAAMEGLYDGEVNAGLVGVGILNPNKKLNDDSDPFLFEVKIPYILGLMANRDIDKFTPGMKDLVYGNKEFQIISTEDRIKNGKIAVKALADFTKAKKLDQNDLMAQNKKILNENMGDFGYGYLNKAEDSVPPVALTFYSFHIMVTLGGFFILLFMVGLYVALKKKIEDYRGLLKIFVLSIPLGWIASEFGWIVAEVGRQPWAIQDLMPVNIAATNLANSSVVISFTLFAILFTVLLIAEIKIMVKQIKIGF